MHLGDHHGRQSNQYQGYHLVEAQEAALPVDGALLCSFSGVNVEVGSALVYRVSAVKNCLALDKTEGLGTCMRWVMVCLSRRLRNGAVVASARDSVLGRSDLEHYIDYGRAKLFGSSVAILSWNSKM